MKSSSWLTCGLVASVWASVVVHLGTNGAFTPVKRNEEIIFPIGMTPPALGMLFYYQTQFTSPSSIAGATA